MHGHMNVKFIKSHFPKLSDLLHAIKKNFLASMYWLPYGNISVLVVLTIGNTYNSV
jgi:hypothetical protein